MKVTQIGFRFPYILAICFALGACSGMHDSVATVTSVSPNSEPTRTRRAPTPTPVSLGSESTKTRQVLTPTYQPPTLASTCRSSDEVRLVQITEESVDYIYWSEDGQLVVYGTRLVIDEQGGKTRTWWEYDVERGRRHRVAPPFSVDDQILEQLRAARRVQISPSGEYVLYMRVSPGYDNYTPTPEEGPWGPPVEVWAARSDGSQAWKLYGPDASCRTLGDAVWFDRERKVIFGCGYEGPSMVLVARVDGSSVAGLRAETAFTDSLGYEGMALSPDETMLALTGTFGKLQVVPLDGGDVWYVAPFGFSPRWSPDGQRVYYMRTMEEFDDSADIHMYDLNTGTDTKILSSPLCTSDGTELYMRQFPFAVSPLENAVVIFASGSLWLVAWSQ
jgi:dipeptidyl aminopeptidase/acylaminoacyl peptidase